MRTVRAVACVAWLAIGCGSSDAGSLEGKIQGHEIAVKEAIFLTLTDGEVFIAAADEENLCAIMNGEQAPTHEMTLLEVYLANWNGYIVQPLVTGTYSAARTVVGPGQWSYPLLFWTRECITFGALAPNSGTVTVESVGLPEAGGETQVSVELVFGGSQMSGHLKATYCARAARFGNACNPSP
jgi:hypothetical protein